MPASQAEPYSRLAGFQSRSEIRFFNNTMLRGSYHFNQQSVIGNHSIYRDPATCHGPVDDSTFFLEGVHAFHDSLAWPPLSQIEQLKQMIPEAGILEGQDSEGRSITNELQFVPDGYWLTRRWVGEDAPPGGQVLDSLVFHPYPEFPVLWVNGVARMKGIVGQSLTLLVSDSLFIMGDLIVAGTDTTSCHEEAFGRVPVPSTIQLGLIGERDVIIAATLENGAFNGQSAPWNNPCYLDNHPVVERCNQWRRDVILTASVMALGKAFMAEYWRTAVTVGDDPPAPPLECPSEDPPADYGYPGCIIGSTGADRWGKLWFCGSLALDCHGVFGHSSSDPPAFIIGFTESTLRYDENLYDRTPPFWPELEWIDADPPTITLSPEMEGLCGAVIDADLLQQLLESGDLSVVVQANSQAEGGREEFTLSTWLDGVRIAQSEDTLLAGQTRVLHPVCEWPAEEIHELHFTVAWDSQIWNVGGELCHWTLDLGDPDPLVIEPSPALQALCGQQVEWFQFHPLLSSGQIYLHAQASVNALGGFEVLHFECWRNDLLSDSLTVVLDAGESVDYRPQIHQDREDELRSLYLSARWDYQYWNQNGELCTLEFADPDPPVLSWSEAATEACATPVAWSEFRSLLDAGLIWLDFQASPQALGGSEWVRVETWLNDQPVDTVSGILAAGESARFSPNVSALPDDLQSMSLHVRWDNESWNTDDSQCRWTFDAVSLPESTPVPATFTVSIVPNPANPTFTVVYELPVAGETLLELYNLQGQKVRTLAQGFRATGSHRE
ncbi:MAG: hypothetical protein KDC10_11225, partial [Calditrichaeota bacterium]|nr:hypothetical protein [Calditrichota bacterium]